MSAVDPITIVVGQQGAAETAAALQGVEKATQGVATATTQSTAQSTAAAQATERVAAESAKAAEKQQDFSRKSQGAAQALEGLRQTAAGGVNAIFGLSRAFDGVLQVIGLGGPWGKAITAAGALLSTMGVAMALLRSDSKTTSDGMTSDAERVKAAWDEATKALSARREETFSAQLEAIRDRAEEANESVARLSAARERMANAEMAADLEVNANDPRYTPEERKVRELEIRQRYAREGEARRAEAIDEPVRAAANAETEALRAVADRQAAVDRTARVIQQQEQARKQVEAEVEAATEALKKNRDLYGTPARTKLISRLGSAQENLASFTSPGAQGALEGLKTQLSDQQAALEAAKQQSADAERARRQAEEVATTEREVQSREQAANERARQSSMEAAQAARAAKVATGQATPEDPLERPLLDTIGQRRAGRAADFGIGLADRAIARSEAGPATVGNRAIADAASELRGAMSELKDGATEGELVSALRSLTELFRRDSDSASRAELQKLAAELNRLKTQISTSRNR